MQDPVSKITKAKRAGVVAQVLEHLHSKCKTLSSDPSTTSPKKYNKGRKKEKRPTTMPNSLLLLYCRCPWKCKSVCNLEIPQIFKVSNHSLSSF
jgi:hypothetical protein